MIDLARPNDLGRGAASAALAACQMARSANDIPARPSPPMRSRSPGDAVAQLPSRPQDPQHRIRAPGCLRRKRTASINWRQYVNTLAPSKPARGGVFFEPMSSCGRHLPVIGQSAKVRRLKAHVRNESLGPAPDSQTATR